MKRDGEKPRGFVFFTQDYFGDIQVRLMPSSLRIVWLEMLFLMHESPRRGILLQKNGKPYQPDELSIVLNTPIETIKTAINYIVEKGIANTDRSTGALINRKMFRQEKQREINTNNGKKGGNPALVTESKTVVLDDSVNRSDNRAVKPRARVPDPDPDPGPVIFPIPIGSSNTGILSPSLVTPPAEKPSPGTRVNERRIYAQDEAANHYAKRQLELTGTPCVFDNEKPGFVHLAKLRKAFGIGAKETPPGWEDAVTNYFASPLAKNSIADLVTRYSVFHNSPTGSYSKPIYHSGNHNESKSDARHRRLREQAAVLNQELSAAYPSGAGSGNETGTHSALRAAPRRPE